MFSLFPEIKFIEAKTKRENLYYNDLKDVETLEIVKNVSSLTHAHEISILGCYIYINYVINLLKFFDYILSSAILWMRLR